MHIRYNSRCWWTIIFLAALAFVNSGAAQDTKYVAGRPGRQRMIAAPECLTPPDEVLPSETESECDVHDAWLKDVTHWRTERRIRIGYDGSRYQIPSLQWTQRSFIQPQMMVDDRYFYDPVAGKYTVDRYLDDLQTRYGGIDAVLIWSTYPNMGIDDRNQLDMVRSMPGGIAGVKQMVADFHRRGVRVLFPMMMWDQGTRDTKEVVARRDRSPDGGDRRGRNQWRYAGRRPAGVFPGGREDWAPACVPAGRIAARRSAGLESDDVG